VVVLNDEVFVVDADQHAISVFSRQSGHFRRRIGTKGSKEGELHAPTGLAILGGNLVVADSLNHR